MSLWQNHAKYSQAMPFFVCISVFASSFSFDCCWCAATDDDNNGFANWQGNINKFEWISAEQTVQLSLRVSFRFSAFCINIIFTCDFFLFFFFFMCMFVFCSIWYFVFLHICFILFFLIINCNRLGFPFGEDDIGRCKTGKRILQII